MKTDDQIRNEVRDHYSAIARSARAPRAGASAGCCGVDVTGSSGDASRKLGYSDADLGAVPDGANLGLGCGNPRAIAELRAGEVVVDLGAGGGFDAFLAARAVGATGRVIGVDMSSDMVALARDNAAKRRARASARDEASAALPGAAGGGGAPGSTVAAADANAIDNVEFRLGEIEHLPVADATADVVMSNCVINLSPDKRAVYAEAFRVLKPGGRIAISDVVALAPLPAALAADVAARCGCVAGAAIATELEPLLASVGFTDVRVDIDEQSKAVIADWAPGMGYEQLVASARISATKPSGARRDAGAKPGSDAQLGATATSGSEARPGADAAGRDAATPIAAACCAPGCCP